MRVFPQSQDKILPPQFQQRAHKESVSAHHCLAEKVDRSGRQSRWPAGSVLWLWRRQGILTSETQIEKAEEQLLSQSGSSAAYDVSHNGSDR